MDEVVISVLALTLLLAMTIIRHMKNRLKYLEGIIKHLQNEISSIRRSDN
jgi:hypothetical protein